MAGGEAWQQELEVTSPMMDAGVQLPSFLIFLLPETPASGMVSPVFTMSLPALGKP